MNIRIRLSRYLRQAVIERLQQAYRSGQVRLVRRIHALMAIIEGKSVDEVATMLELGAQTVRDYVNAFLYRDMASLSYQKPAGRPSKLTKTQRKELADLIKAGPEAAGYTTACWSSVLIQDLLLRSFGVEYHPHYICELLDQLGFSFQKARFASDHLNQAARAEWEEQTWPAIVRLAQGKGALILFGDEAGFAQWGSLSYTWAPKGEQPLVKTCGKRKAYKVFGLIDYGSGRFFWQGQTERFTSGSYATFLAKVLTQTQQHIILIQDGARYHTSQAMNDFFALHAERLTKFQLPSYSPDFNPIEFLWKKVKKQATHLKYFATFDSLTASVDKTLHQFANLPSEILALMGRYCESLGTEA
jgi:transposase